MVPLPPRLLPRQVLRRITNENAFDQIMCRDRGDPTRKVTRSSNRSLPEDAQLLKLACVGLNCRSPTTESNELAPLAPSVLNRTYAQTSNTNNGVAGEDIGATSGHKLAEVRLNTKSIKTQVSVVTPVTPLRSKTSDLNATKPLELETKYETEILRLFEGSTWPHDDTYDIGLALDSCDPRQGVLTERHPELATITNYHVRRNLKGHYWSTIPIDARTNSEGERKWQQRKLSALLQEVCRRGRTSGIDLRPGLCSLKPLTRFIRKQGGRYALELPHSSVTGGHFIETYALTMAQSKALGTD